MVVYGSDGKGMKVGDLVRSHYWRDDVGIVLYASAARYYTHTSITESSLNSWVNVMWSTGCMTNESVLNLEVISESS